MKMLYWILCFFFVHCSFAEYISVIFENSESKDFPKIRCAEHDAISIGQTIQEYVGGHVQVVQGKQATTQMMLDTLQTWNQCQENDVLCLYVISNSIFSNDTLSLIFSDGIIDINTIFQELQTCPAQGIFLCFDIFYSCPSLLTKDNPKYIDISLLQQNTCVLFSASHNSMSLERSGVSFFSYFFRMALRNVEYLNQTADKNKDGVLLISELAEWLCTSVTLSGFGQIPIYFGTCNVAFKLVQKKPCIEWIEPKEILGDTTQEVIFSGFLRHNFTIQNVVCQGNPLRIGKITKKWAQGLQKIYWDHTYWFYGTLKIQSGIDSVYLSIEDENGQWFVHEFFLPKRKKGWHNEWMPMGMTKSHKKNTYIWGKDNSEMVYIPTGIAILGFSQEQAQELKEHISELLTYLQEQKKWNHQDLNIRLTLLASLESCKKTLQEVSEKMQSVYKKTETWSNIHSHLGKTEENNQQTEKNINQECSFPEELAELNKSSNIFTEKDFFISATNLLRQCYTDIERLRGLLHEQQEIYHYLENILNNYKTFVEIYKIQEININGFYMDKYETSNQQYSIFCQQTARPYPPNFIEKDPQLPVVHVSWYDAQAYATWSGKQLPTIQQWEYAARTTKGYLYPWGNSYPTLQNCNGDVPSEMSTPCLLPNYKLIYIDTLSASEYGCYHLSGNVWEWCQNKCPIQGSLFYIAKGGSFSSTEILLSPCFSISFLPQTRRSDVGLRFIK
ncbi:MAG: SUMF1/EgtB/PvdO family nonheme iron enzyme [Planctomycetes bacterium]|jgi:hypothetical protein|nr:SUMF1/EgtB/PvdO family nonheme iron enzyme [Planctomycetota bacterium]HPY75029.1 SUMF1/EgtB/PvdO family nonheme iron enzyme [Planctomycetota bacterium]HQB00816.1 SUMF1/EgtB/PvdO family nonheme iron enzyme [Planctomycetota bacterium]